MNHVRSIVIVLISLSLGILAATFVRPLVGTYDLLVGLVVACGCALLFTWADEEYRR